MTKYLRNITISTVGAFSLSIAGFVFSDDHAEHQAFLATPISLSQAIAAAESKSGAKAISAEFEDENGKWVYSIELISTSGHELEVEVDSQTAAILKIETDDKDVAY
ncbi:PepSY domain-containing protein [Dasania marina]|uniref:PepSY domain-containing protein n=1 Tax=Dasania marina TaxID=471499 RepID=UPI0030D98810|tara:strand:- start:38449 stop:38769 length:321 start_codon:yes stop_codon:yes gene_type:complete